MSFGPDTCHDATWNKFIQVLNALHSEILSYINYGNEELVGCSNISGVILDVSFNSMPTPFYDINVRTLIRPRHTQTLVSYRKVY